MRATRRVTSRWESVALSVRLLSAADGASVHLRPEVVSVDERHDVLRGDVQTDDITHGLDRGRAWFTRQGALVAHEFTRAADGEQCFGVVEGGLCHRRVCASGDQCGAGGLLLAEDHVVGGDGSCRRSGDVPGYCLSVKEGCGEWLEVEPSESDPVVEMCLIPEFHGFLPESTHLVSADWRC